MTPDLAQRDAAPQNDGTAPSICLENLICDFPGVRALDNVTLNFFPGTVHAITGENGAGKSSLLRILSGWVKPTGGWIKVGTARFRSVRHPSRLGIRSIPQEPALAGHLTVAENIFLGRLPQTRWRKVDWPATFKTAEASLSRVGLDELPPRELAKNLSIAQRQLVEIARALANGGEIFLFDEPTSSLSSSEVKQVTQLIRELKAAHKTVLYVSHRMDEVFTTCDQVTVLRDGKVMATLPVNAIQPDEVIRLMIGREICLKKSTTRKPTDDKTRLRVKGLYGRFLKNIHFVGRRGEILGLGGLMGSGRTTLLQTLFGCRPMSQGWIEVDGQRLSPHSARQSMNAGLAYIPEDRKADGLALQLTIAENFALPILDRLQRCGWLKRRERTRTAESLARQLGLRYRRVSDRVERLSGGNQQKIVLGKWLARAPRVLLLDEPTRGIDVGAKADIHRLIQELADAGICAILASSDMPELLSLCDRILVMREGEITGELLGEQRTEEAILRMAAPPSAG